ncbi:MAG: GAF domain-containing protein [Chloroflexota bacterium]
MFELDSVSLGITLLVLGLAFFLLTYFLLRVIPRIRSLPKTISKHSSSSKIPAHGDAVLLVQTGGRIVYLNQAARDSFNLWEKEPNLEHLVRRSRPGDVFLGLCSSAGQARFSIDGHPVEGTSYFIPNEDGNAIMLSLRSHRISALVSGETGHASQTFEVLTELSQSIAANLELEATLQAILQSVEQLVPTDFAEITIWDPDNEYLIPYRFVDLDGLDRHLERSTDRYPKDQGYSGYMAEHRQHILISDVDAHSEFRSIIDRKRYPFHSYLGIPLLVGGELIGTLDITSLGENAYTENDIKLLRMLSGQAAIALHNALLYQEEQRRAQELSGLANLTQAVSSVRDFADIFAHLVPGITPLLDIEIAGFLIYNETLGILEARDPFFGVPPQFVELYRVSIPIDSPAEAIWMGQETIVSTNAPEDPRLIDLGLDHPARAAGIRDTVLIPLTSGVRSLGYLQVANKRDKTFFNPDDLRLLSIIAGQAAPIIENADLIQQSVGRALRSEALRRIASLSGSVATLDEIFKYSLLELARLLKADIAAIFLLDENLGELRVHALSIYGVPPDAIPGIVRFPLRDADFHLTVTGSKSSFIAGTASEYERIPPVYKSLTAVLGGESAIGVPLVTRDRALGEIMLCSNLPEHFSPDDVKLAATVADQLAIAIERASLASQTDVNLRQRVEQLTALTRISRELNTSVQLEHLLQRVFDEAQQTTHADCGTILLFELGENRPKFPKVVLCLGDSIQEEIPPLERLVLEDGAPLIVEDFNNLPVEHDPAIWRPAHEGVQSALIVPIAYQENVAGLIHLHANSAARFDNAALQITQALAVQAAIAIGNAHRYQELVQRNELLNRRVETLAILSDASQKLHLGQPLEQSLEDIAYSIQTSTSFNIVLISVYDIADGAMHRISGAGIPLNVMDELREHAQPWQDVSSILKSEFRFGRSYYIPSDQRPAIPEVVRTITLLPDQNGKENEGATWHPKDLLLVPLMKPSGEPLGLISVDAPRDHLRPDFLTIETLEIFASQASLVIESQQQLHDLENQVKDFTDQLESFSEDQKKLSILTQKELEDTRTIKNLTHLVQRVNAGLRIVEVINRQPDRAAVFSSLVREIISQWDMDIALVVEPGAGGPRLLYVSGDIPEGVNPEALLGQRSPLIRSLQDGTTFMVPNIEEDVAWQQSPLLSALETVGFLCIPIISLTGLEAAVLAISHARLPLFMPEDEQLFELFSRQISTALNNLTLLTETGYRLREVNLLLEFSRQLGGLKSTQILRTLVESALGVVQSAQSGMVALFDSDQNMLIPQAARGYLHNDTMLDITCWPVESLPGQVFDLGRAVRIGEVDFAKHYKLLSDDLLRYRAATGGALPISCMVVPIQSGDNKLGVIVLDNFGEAAAFSEEDQALISSLAQQTALTLENARLYQAVEERAAQLQALSDVAATITSSLEPEALIHSLLEILETIIPYNTGTLWLRDGDTLTIQSARGFENSADLIGIATTVEDSRLFHEMIATNQPISVEDIRSDSRFPSVETEYLSWLGVPLIAKGVLIGVIALDKMEAHYYTVEHIRAATTFASQAAVALENAALYQQSLQRSTELDQRSQRLTLLNRFSNQISSVLDTDHILDTSTHELLHALPGSAVSVVMWESAQVTLRAEFPHRGADLPMPLPESPIFEHLQETLGVFNTQDIAQEDMLAPLAQFFAERRTRGLLILPLVTGEIVHGFILIHTEQNYHFSADEIELARIICNQAAVALQNASLYAETIRLAGYLEQRVDERTRQLGREHKRAQSLVQIMRELSASLDLDHVLNRTLALLNETIGAEQSTVLLVRPDETTFYYQASLGYTDPPPRGGRPSRLAIDAGLAGWVITQRRGTLIDDLHLDDRWVASSGRLPEHRSAIAVPLMVGAEALGVILLFHRKANVFSTSDEELSLAAAAQIAAAINNSALFNLIRDQAEGLGNMLRTQQIEASRSRGILEAVADGVLVTDVNSEITLFNESAQRILALDSSEVIGRSLDDFAGLFGRASQAWMNTIRDWSINPASRKIGDIYAEQITLDDKRVVSVHLAPVNMGNEFLGTVSIFRDITHQIEVDRLKSEFVATVSHELRTPMTSIKGYVEILLMGAAGTLNEQQTQFLDIVKSNTERLNVLVNDLLDVSRIEAGKVMLSIQPLDMRPLIEAIIRDQNRQSKEDNKPLSIEFDFPLDLPRISGDEEKIRRILANLVSNAYDYTFANGHILIRVQNLKDEIQIDVQDDGIGIPPEDQERVFERFFRGEDPLVLATGGTGLGLSIVRQLIEMHRGRIWVESSGIPGEGSIFSFTLPRQQPEDE